jgi:hypothetical protein
VLLFQHINGRYRLIDAIELSLTDGDLRWDRDGIANGSIEDPGFAASAEQLFSGSATSDELIGNVLANTLISRQGNDTLIGNGGADVLYGGRGDDTIVVNADNVAQLSLSGTSQAIARIDGGSGIDTLELDGEGIMLDLSLVSSAALQNIEKIDLTGSGDNTLKLSLTDMLQHFDDSNVFNSSNTTSGLTATVSKNQLMVDGDAGDKVELTDFANWTAEDTNVVANGETYVVYNHNTSAQQLLIDLQLTVL